MYYETIEDLINDLNSKEKKVLQIASNAIYFEDRSNYIKALWEIINEISNNKINYCNNEVYKLLNDE